MEDPKNAPDDDVYTLSSTLEKAPDQADDVTLTFEKGVPVALDGKAMSPVALLEQLNQLGGKHGVGQVDMVENRLVGIKSRGIYETPGGTILYAAHRDLEQLVLDRDTLHEKQKIALTYADLVYDGRWFTPLREALDAFVEATQQVVTGTVTLKLYKGNVISAGVEADKSLYIEELASFTDSDFYDQQDANGFIRVYGLPMKVNGLVNRKES